MRARLTAAVLAYLAAGLCASTTPALATSYTVTGFGDSPGGAPACNEVQPLCPTLRDAVLAANQLSDQDSIQLQAGTYTLTTGQLALTQGVIILGAGPRSTVVQAGPTSRVFDIASSVQLVNMTIQNGTFTGGAGGNILVEVSANLALYLVRVTGGNAGSGGGISNGGVLSIQNSLVDGNRATGPDGGGGVLNNGSIGVAPELTVLESTIAGNTADVIGGGIRSIGNADNSVQLLHATVGRNTAGGVSLDRAHVDAEANASIISDNGGANCGSFPLSGGLQSVESGTDCGLAPADGNLQNTDPGLAAGLSDQGGPTNLLTIPASSPAINLVNPCFYPVDQRGFARYTTQGEPCDAGAYEQSATGDTVQPPPPPPAPPVPTPAPTVVPTPVAGQSVGAKPVSGKVLVKVPGSNQFVPLDESVIKNGAEIDTRDGVVDLTRSDGGRARIFDGIFKLSQPGGVTTMTLSEKLTGCSKGKASAAAKKPKTRKLWGDGKGKFRTRGQYSAATIRGTKWLVQDECTTTTTKVTQGAVTVADFGTGKTKIVRKGKSYVARAKKR
jgi:hypothetical protein